MLRRLLAAFCCALMVVPARASAEEPDAITIDTDPGSIVRIEGEYPARPNVCPAKQPSPLRARLRGTVTLTLHDDGIRITDRLGMTDYLKGLDEVPRSWPEEALRAQVIAARSFALDSMRRGASAAAKRGYDICATVACQVYRGASVEQGAFGERWVQAVEETEGRALTHRDRVIQAFYFSTSTGKTRSSFPGGTPLPYLPSVDGEDGDSPLARWRVPIGLRDLAAMLRARGLWGNGALERVTRDGDEVVLRGPGQRRTMTRGGLRGAVNSEGPCLFPGRYPTRNERSDGRYPQTLPSSTYSVRMEGSSVEFRGRGWGHDVGMSQYGARSLAERGRSAEQILKHFYGPATLDAVEEPDAITVLIASGLEQVRIEVEGRARVLAGQDEANPGRRFTVTERKDALSIARGAGPSLPPLLSVEADGPLEGRAGDTIEIAATIGRAARVSVDVSRDGDVVTRSAETSFERGEVSARLQLVTDDGEPLTAGRYRAMVAAFDGYDRVRAKSVRLTVTAAPSPSPSPSPSEVAAPPAAARGRSAALPVAAGLLTLLSMGGAAWAWRRRLSRT